MNSTTIDISNLAIGYNKSILSGINLHAEGGRLIAILGANGIGKSTFLRTLSGEIKPRCGQITINGQSIEKLTVKQMARLLSIVVHADLMIDGLRVRELISLGRQPYTGWTGVLSPSDKQLINGAMKEIGIWPLKDKYMTELSDGERQKVMIARALAQDTPIMLLDEPLSFLDPAARIEIFSLLGSLARDKNKIIILSCHDIAMSLRMASELWLFSADKKISATMPADAITDGLLNTLFNNNDVMFSTKIGDFIAKNNGRDNS